MRPLTYKQVHLSKEYKMETFLYTVQEAAKALRISRSKVYGLMKEGELQSVKIGGSRRLRRQDLIDYVETLGSSE